jgi:pimeloyl-ACP methyl ester carboxylesterase
VTENNHKPAFEYFQWKQDLAAELEAGSQVAETRQGPIEYAVKGEGHGQPVVVGFHGGPGGYDQVFPLWEGVTRHGFSLLAWSRPGYLRTPLCVGCPFKAQADAVAALLDDLNIRRVGLIGFSAGGACAMLFAAHYPERVWALILESSVSQAYRFVSRDRITEQFFTRLLFNDPAVWLYNQLAAHYPEFALRSMLAKESILDREQAERLLNQILEDPDRVSHLMAIIKSMSPFSLRQKGLENDLSQLAAIDTLPLSDIKAPTLIIHATADGDVPFHHAEYAASKIPKAELAPVTGGFHILTLCDQAETVARKRVRMLLKHRPKESQERGDTI